MKMTVAESAADYFLNLRIDSVEWHNVANVWAVIAVLEKSAKVNNKIRAQRLGNRSAAHFEHNCEGVKHA